MTMTVRLWLLAYIISLAFMWWAAIEGNGTMTFLYAATMWGSYFRLKHYYHEALAHAEEDEEKR